MTKVIKTVAVVVLIAVVFFFAVSYKADRSMLNSVYERTPDVYAPMLPDFEQTGVACEREEASFTLGDQTLRGYVYRADDPKGFIIFRHGFASNQRSYLTLTMAMVERGWTVFAYDAIGCGESDGDDIKGMPQSAIDVEAAVNYVRESGLAGDLPICLWGHSWGGYGVAAALSNVPDVAACVTMSGFYEPTAIINELAEQRLEGLASTQRPTIWIVNKIGFGKDANRSAVDSINATDAPVLVIHGNADETVLYDGASIIAQQDAITNPNVEYYTFSEEGRNGHNTYFYDADANQYFGEKTAAFAALVEEYDEEIPDDVFAQFMADYDMARANVANPELIDLIDNFLSKAVGR